MYYQNLMNAIDEGLSGKNEGLPTGLDRLDNYISIKKKMMVGVSGSSGSGKTALTNQAFIINPFEYCLANKKKIKIILFSMERSIIFTHTKWLASKIFRDTGEIIDTGLLLGWYKGKKLTKSQLEKTKRYESYYNKLEEDIIVYQGGRTPEDIKAKCLKFFNKRGEIVQKKDMNGNLIDVYDADDPNEDVIIVVDHIGLTKPGVHGSKKGGIDTLIEYLQDFRDIYNASVVVVTQINRELSKNTKSFFEPHLDHIKETGSIGDALDISLMLFDPIRYNSEDINYGKAEVFKCPTTGHKFFRNISILKNSYGIDGVGVGCVFLGQLGLFKTLPKASYIKEHWNPESYESIFNYNYFLE